jgi:hypothetical protein
MTRPIGLIIALGALISSPFEVNAERVESVVAQYSEHILEKIEIGLDREVHIKLCATIVHGKAADTQSVCALEQLLA